MRRSPFSTLNLKKPTATYSLGGWIVECLSCPENQIRINLYLRLGLEAGTARSGYNICLVVARQPFIV
jgi:hypothetical protein